MLDTDTVSYALRGVESVVQSLLETSPTQVAMSSITLAEFRFGADLRGSKKLHRIMAQFVAGIIVLPFDNDAADSFGKLASQLRSAGTPIGQMDTLIAAHCLSTKLVLVTNNQKHFSKIKGLKTENWFKP